MTTEKINSKVIGIGLNKTGTSTLARCFNILGYRVKGCSRALLKDVIKKKDFSRVIDVARHYDAFEDWPWPLIYRELDHEFKNSKFILTIRKNPQTWLNSLKSHSLKTPPFSKCEILAYGYNYPHRHEHEHIVFYRHHQKEVKKYFIGREKDFIELCWENGDGWEQLCNFLGKKIPDIPFPHENRGSEKKVRAHRLLTNRFLLWMGY